MPYVLVNSMFATAAAVFATFVAFHAHQRPCAAPLDGAEETAVDADRRAEKYARERLHDLKHPRVVTVTEGVHVAVGFASCNIVMIEGGTGIIIVDTSESEVTANQVFREFRKITSKPLVGIILTHFHGDHAIGAKAFMSKAAGRVNVYMHSSTALEYDRSLNIENFKRAAREAGHHLKRVGGEHVHHGIGNTLKIADRTHFSVLESTHTFDDRQVCGLAGIDFELIHTPGQTPDQVAVWLPNRKALMPGENIYRAFPNLFAIRGSPPRDALQWYRSLDVLRDLNAEHLVPAHAHPISGAGAVRDALTHYRDAIQFVHDQTVRLMRKDLPLDEIVARVVLPSPVAAHAFLQERERGGRVAWSVRGVYTRYASWFDGSPVDLDPLSDRERARRWAELLTRSAKFTYDESSGVEHMLQQAASSYQLSARNAKRHAMHLRDELQWALELATNVRKVSREGSVCEKRARALAVDAMRALASSTPNRNARNYYLSYAHELESGADVAPSASARRARIMTSKLDLLMTEFPTRFDADRCVGDRHAAKIKVMIAFTDCERRFVYVVRNCVVQVQVDPAHLPCDFDAVLTLDSLLWRELLAGDRMLTEFGAGSLHVEGNAAKFKLFMDSFDRTP